MCTWKFAQDQYYNKTFLMFPDDKLITNLMTFNHYWSERCQFYTMDLYHISVIKSWF